MAWWAVAAGVAGGLLKNESERKSARATSRSLAQSARDKIKAADSVLYADLINRSQQEIEGRQVQSSQLTAFASSGVDITSGSVQSVVAETESQILRNNFLSKQKADAESNLLRSEAKQLNHQGKLAERNAKNNQVANIVGGILGGLG